MFMPGPSTTSTPMALASAPRAAPTRRTRSGFQVEPRATAGGKQVAGALPVTVSATLNTSGQLLLTLSCKSKAEDTEAYTAVLTFNPGKKQVEPPSAIPESEGTLPPDEESVISRNVSTEDYEDRKEAIFTWTYAGMKK